MKKILVKGIVKLWTEVDYNCPTKKSSSILRFSTPSVQIPIDVGNPKVAETKGSGQGRRLPKHSKLFVSQRETMIPRPCACSICGYAGHNKKHCPAIPE